MMVNQVNVKQRQVRVLLVEDVLVMRRLLRIKLENRGLEVCEAGSLKQAMEVLDRTQRLDLVLLDLKLPDGLGLDLIEFVPSTARVVAMTAAVTHEVMEDCKLRGVKDVVSKSNVVEWLEDLAADLVRMPISFHGTQTKTGLASSDADAERSYVEFLRSTLEQLVMGYENLDFDALGQIAHRLSGTAIHFGYASVGTDAKALSLAVSSSNIGQIELALDRLIAGIRRAAKSPCLGESKGSVPLDHNAYRQ